MIKKDKVVKKRFDRIFNAIENMAYTKYEFIPENEEVFIFGFKQIKTDKVDFYILFGCKSVDLKEKHFHFLVL